MTPLNFQRRKNGKEEKICSEKEKKLEELGDKLLYHNEVFKEETDNGNLSNGDRDGNDNVAKK